MWILTNRTKAGLWLLVVFMLGSLFGASLSYLWQQGAYAALDERRHEQPSEGKDREKTARVLAKLSERLQLDSAQQTQVEAILLQSRDLYRAEHKESKKEKRRIREQTLNNIRQLLRPEQRHEFEEYLEERRERHEKNK